MMNLFTKFKNRSNAEVNGALAQALHGAVPPGFPELTLRILAKLRDQEVAFEDVADAIQWDPALTLKLLATVNSAAYSPRKPIDDVRHAVSYLGRAQLESLVLAVAARGALPSPSARGFDAKRFWHAAARRASLSRAFASKLHPAREGEAFSSALLLDLAIPVQSAALGDRYADALVEWHASPGAKLADIERARIGQTHTEVGTLLAKSWSLPESLVRSIALHHEAESSDQELLPSVRLVAPLREVATDDALDEVVECARADYGLAPDWTAEAVATSAGAAEELSRLIA